jgi:hypothetical protein
MGMRGRTRSRQVMAWAVCSRALVWCIALVARFLVPAYDTSTNLLGAARSDGLGVDTIECGRSALDRWLRASVDGFESWDGAL